MKAFWSCAVLMAVLTGCVGSGNIPQMYPDFPDNDYCFKKIAEYQAYIDNPANQKTETVFFDGKEQTCQIMTLPDTPEGYLGILLGRGAIEAFPVVLTSAQAEQLSLNMKKLPDFILGWYGRPQRVGLEDYFSYRDNRDLRIITFYYRNENFEQFQEWLRKYVPVEKKPQTGIR